MPSATKGYASRAMRSCAIVLFTALASLACGSGDDADESSSSVTTLSTMTSSEASSETQATDASTADASTGTDETTGEPPGAEYGPCTSITDCPEGMFYVCLQDVTDGAVCAPGCTEQADCPPPPPGGSQPPVCTLIDGRTRCAMLGCQSDEDCPTGMTCHIEGPNWCHWPF